MTPKDFFREIDESCSDNLYNQINFERSEVQLDQSVIIHFWDGRRFHLKGESLPNGCSYNVETGEPE